MTYAGFLLLFLLLPLILLVIVLRKRLLDRRYLLIMSLLTVVALVYMAPWDHFAAIWGLWSWDNSRTWGIRWWAIPPEEYLFCILEALLAITLTFAVLTRKDKQSKIRVSTSSEDMNSDELNSATSKIIYHNRASIPTRSTPMWIDRVGRENES